MTKCKFWYDTVPIVYIPTVREWVKWPLTTFTFIPENTRPRPLKITVVVRSIRFLHFLHCTTLTSDRWVL